MRIYWYSAITIAVFLTAGCETTGSKKSSAKSSSSPKASRSSSKSSQDDSDEISAKRKNLVQSLSNNAATDYTVNTGKAASIASKISLGTKDKSDLEGKLSAQRVSSASLSSVMGTAKKIAQLEMQKGADRHINDAVKLDIALAAINSKKYSMAYYYLTEITSSKSSSIRAAAHNALGVIALEDGRIPEAVESFKEALTAEGGYKAARLNLGFAALKGGDSDAAMKAIGNYSGNWFVDYGLISAARLEGDPGKTNALCDRTLSKKGNHKGVLFNCGLHNAQTKKDYGKAKAMMNKAANARGGEAHWNARISAALRDVSAAERADPPKANSKKDDNKKPGK